MRPYVCSSNSFQTRSPKKPKNTLASLRVLSTDLSEICSKSVRYRHTCISPSVQTALAFRVSYLVWYCLIQVQIAKLGDAFAWTRNRFNLVRTHLTSATRRTDSKYRPCVTHRYDMKVVIRNFGKFLLVPSPRHANKRLFAIRFQYRIPCFDFFADLVKGVREPIAALAAETGVAPPARATLASASVLACTDFGVGVVCGSNDTFRFGVMHANASTALLISICRPEQSADWGANDEPASTLGTTTESTLIGEMLTDVIDGACAISVCRIASLSCSCSPMMAASCWRS